MTKRILALQILSLVFLPTLSFAELNAAMDSSSQAEIHLFSIGGGSACSRLSDWSCIGQTVNAMCAIDPKRNLYGHCFIHDSGHNGADCRCQ